MTSKHVFIHCNKTGGTFIKEFMAKYMNGKVLKYKHAPVRMLPRRYRNKVIIGVVRNPFDWYVSYYHASHNDCKNISFEDYLKRNMVNPRGKLGKREMNSKFPLLKPSNTHLKIGQYTYYYINFFYYNANKIFMQKIGFDVNKPDLNIVMRTETLREDMKKVFGFEKEIDAFPVMNKSNRKHYHEYYTPELRLLVEKKDRFILDNYGYKY